MNPVFPFGHTPYSPNDPRIAGECVKCMFQYQGLWYAPRLVPLSQRLAKITRAINEVFNSAHAHTWSEAEALKRIKDLSKKASKQKVVSDDVELPLLLVVRKILGHMFSVSVFNWVKNHGEGELIDADFFFFEEMPKNDDFFYADLEWQARQNQIGTAKNKVRRRRRTR